MPLESRYAGQCSDNENKKYHVQCCGSVPPSFSIVPEPEEDIDMMDDGEDNHIHSILKRNNNDFAQSNTINYEDPDLMIMEQSPDFEIIGGNISFLIVDSNFFIAHLDIIEELKNLSMKFQLKIVIPFYVLHELDGLKRCRGDTGLSGSNKDVSALAKRANDWIFTELAQSSSVVKGQKLSQRINKDAIKDDSILDCCLYFSQRYSTNLVVLLTDDRNLSSKALANDLSTIMYQHDIDAAFIAQKCLEENVARFGKRDKIEVVSDGNGIPLNLVAAKSEPTQPLRSTKEWEDKVLSVDNFNSKDEVLTALYNEMKTVLISALHRCMVVEFKEDLDLVRDYNKEDVVSLRDCSQLLIRFWMTVFQQYFRAMPGKFVPFEEEGSGRNIKRKPVYTDIPEENDVNKFVTFWSATLMVIYNGVMDDTQTSALEILVKRWNKMAALVA